MRHRNMEKKQSPLHPLEDPRLKQPFGTVPDGYWADLEDAVHERIHPRSESDFEPVTLWERMKSHVFLALSFCVIMGFGYGVMWLTGTASPSEYEADMDLYSLVEEGYIHLHQIDYQYDYFFTSEDVSWFDEKALLQECIDGGMDLQLTEEEILEYLYD